MSDHAELQIVDAMAAILHVGLGGVEIDKNRATRYLPTESYPRVNVQYGDDELGEWNVNTADWNLSVVTEVIDRMTEAGIGQSMSDLRRDIYAAIMADRTLGGLSLVITTMPASASEPQISAEGDESIVRRRITWTVRYRTSVTDATAGG